MMYCSYNYLEYLILDKNKRCEDAGAITLVHKKSCKDAVEKLKNSLPDTYFRSSLTYSNYPKGCFFFIVGNVVYFNSQNRNEYARNEHARPICQTSNGK